MEVSIRTDGPAAAAEFMKVKWKWLFMTRLKTNVSKWREQGALD